ncbi:helix-turn-helix domain-containing protein [Pseudomonas sp. A-R-26]|uniref:helix-turn-helix domain-containing protein n=1 Tax=Pseudomonas sp. A-R-26 TaxID=2832404 RepID=UPI001CBB5B58|nr:helix-turn-helix domain-containing protein [Pseudomonas sp. A-R-26]
MLYNCALNLIPTVHAVLKDPATKSANDDSIRLTSDLLSSAGLEALNARIAANADQWLADNAPITKIKLTRTPKATSGRKPTMIENPFFGYIGCMTYWGRYPEFALDIIEGVARLDWHNRPIGKGGKSMPLSVRNLVVILEYLQLVTNEAVEDLLQLRSRHARRYVKAIELIIPSMMECRPRSLINEMDGIESEPKACEWDDSDDLYTPNAEELAKLHHDMRTFTEYATAEEYERDDVAKSNGYADVAALPARKQHPKRGEVMALLVQDVPKLQIERMTGVQRKTITKWQIQELTVAA